MISTDRITVRPVHSANRRVLVGSVLALVIAVGIVETTETPMRPRHCTATTSHRSNAPKVEG